MLQHSLLRQTCVPLTNTLEVQVPLFAAARKYVLSILITCGSNEVKQIAHRSSTRFGGHCPCSCHHHHKDMRLGCLHTGQGAADRQVGLRWIAAFRTRQIIVAKLAAGIVIKADLRPVDKGFCRTGTIICCRQIPPAVDHCC